MTRFLTNQDPGDETDQRLFRPDDTQPARCTRCGATNQTDCAWELNKVERIHIYHRRPRTCLRSQLNYEGPIF